MKFVFEKLGSGKYDRLRIERCGRAEEIACPKIGGIPHDMVHFAVEKAMRANGFMRRIAGGETLAYRMVPDFESDQMERLVEVMQADANSDYPAPADLIDMYRVTCDARGVKPYNVNEDDIARIRSEMRELEHQWSATPAGGALVLAFDE